MLHSPHRRLIVSAALIALLFAALYGTLLASVPNRQPWVHSPGSCDPALAGAVFSLPATGCGGSGTTFDTQQVFAPAVLKDIASAQAPCPGIANGAACFRMWYVGQDQGGTYRIGYAISPDGSAWNRVPGTETGGSVLGTGAAGAFDSHGTAYMTVMKDGATFKMWYAGVGQSYIEGIGYATSLDGRAWTRVPGPLQGDAVLRPSGVDGVFDRDVVNTPNVIKDRASASAPCAGVAEGATCYRMWYEGVNQSAGYIFSIGYATSPDGLNWTRVAGYDPSGAVLGRAPFGNFDENSVGVPMVMKDGAIYRMWYEAKDYADRFRLGYVVSTDGIAWERPEPNLPIWQGSDDPGSFNPDNVWAAAMLKDGPLYRMWYSVSTQPDAQRIGYATMTPGTPLAALSLEQSGDDYTLHFTTGVAIPASGSVLLTLPSDVPIEEVTAGGLSGFGAGTTLRVVAAAVSDAPAHRTTRGALLVQLGAEAGPGPKSVSFSLANPPASGTLLVQTFDSREVIEHGTIDLGTATTPTPTHTSTPSGTATNTPVVTTTATSTPSGTATNTPVVTTTATSAPTSTATNTPVLTITATSTPSGTTTNTPVLTTTASPSETPAATATPTVTPTVVPDPTPTTPPIDTPAVLDETIRLPFIMHSGL